MPSRFKHSALLPPGGANCQTVNTDGDRAFSAAVPPMWNSLYDEVLTAESVHLSAVYCKHLYFDNLVPMLCSEHFMKPPNDSREVFHFEECIATGTVQIRPKQPRTTGAIDVKKIFKRIKNVKKR